MGFVVVQWIFGPDWIHTFISSSVTYLICAFGPRKHIGTLCFVWVMGYMTGCHIFTMYNDYMSEKFDFLRTQMVITMKLTSFAYNYFDGTYDHDKVFSTDPARKHAKIFAQRREFAITELPSLLEFFGYVYCFPCALVGPAFEYNDYIKAINGREFQFRDAKGELVRRTPSTLLPALQRLAVGVAFMLLYLRYQPTYSIAQHYQPGFIAVHSIAARTGLLLVSLLVERFKFYFVWKVAEGSAVLGGFGFEGYEAGTGRELGWRGAENIDIVGMETATSVQAFTRSWNKRTQGWLERYTYQRMGRSLAAVYLVSALWHGLYPGYFLAFLSVPLPTTIERLAREKITPRVVPEYNPRDPASYPRDLRGRLYEAVCWLATFLSMSYVMQVFYMISLQRALAAWGGYFYGGHLVMLAVMLGLSALPAPAQRQREEGKKKSE